MGDAVSPPQYSDAKGNRWEISLSLGLVDRILSAHGVDLLADDGDTGPLFALLCDRRKLAAVLWSASTAVGGKEFTQEQFVDALDGDALTNGWGALVDAIVFFTPKQNRAAMQAAIDAQVAAMEKGVAAMVEVAKSQATNDAMSAAAEKMQDEMQSGLTKALAVFAGNSGA